MIAKKAIRSGRILISIERARYSFHDFDDERISFRESSIISAITPSTPNWGASIVDVAEIIPAELLINILESVSIPPAPHNML
jgi:hypothetical protein